MKRRIALLALALCLALTPFALLGASPIEYGWLVANRATVTNGGLTVSGATVLADVTVADGLTVSDGDVTLAGTDLVIGQYQRYTAQAVELVSQDSAIIPTGTYQPISGTATAAVSTSSISITAASAGNVVTLINTGNQSIVLTDTGTLLLSGNTTLGPNDSLTILSNGTSWIEIGQTDN